MSLRAAARLCMTAVVGLAVAAAAGPAVAGPETAREPAFETLQRMGRGINVLGYDGIWDGGVDAPFRLASFRTIRRAGFRHVRINLMAFRHMDAADRLAPHVLDALDRVVEATVAAGLVPVIDEHDNDFCQRRPEACVGKLRAFWSQIAARYAGRYPQAVFEILNEPGGSMTPEQWNALNRQVLAIIRAGNPKRSVIVASINSETVEQIRALTLPADDRNIIVTVHYYKPFRFTHQGAPWSPRLAALHDIDWGSADDQQRVRDDFAVVSAWGRSQQRPIYLGEFGVYEAAPAAARGRWAGFLARAAEQLGWAWAYWQFDHDFALFDEATQRWNAPLLQALILPR